MSENNDIYEGGGRAGTACAGLPPILSREYWRAAVLKLWDTRTLVYAALIIALRIVVKAFRIPIAPGLNITFDCYINALGSIAYGPVVALLVGAASDTVGALLFPSGAYFFPFIIVEMSSGFIFALFLWGRRLSSQRILLAKFTVNFVCNIIINSAIMKIYYSVLYGSEKSYSFINAARIIKNLIMFPLEAMLILIVLGAALPLLTRMRLLPHGQERLSLRRRDVAAALLLTLAAVALLLFYIFFLSDWLKSHNITLF